MKKIISLLLTIFVFATCLTCPVAFAAEDVIGELEIEYVSRRSYTVSADITANTGRDYTFVAASYGEGNTLVGAERVEVPAPTQGTETTISADFDLSAKAYVKDTKYTKFLLWDMDTYEPLATAVTENYEAVEVARGKTTGGATTTTGVAYVLQHLPTSRLTDNVETVDGSGTDAHASGAGFYHTANNGVMYVDLGRAYKIDHIEVVAYMPASYLRSSNYDIIVTNTIPDLTPYNASNPGTDVLVANVGVMYDAVNNVSGKKVHYVPGGTEAKRYVSFEKLGSETDGLVIQEVRVYVLEEDMPEPVTYIDVTDLDGVTTGGVKQGTAVYTFTHLPTSRLIDEVETDTSANPSHAQGAGFYGGSETGCMYVDLGRPYKIDHIEVVAYMAGSYLRSSNYDIIVTNTIPDLTPYNASNPGTDVLVANVGVMNDAVNNISGKKTYYLPDDIGEKQVVSFEKFAYTDGLVIQEVRVYVEQSNVKPMPTNVALNKTGYTYPGTITGYPASSVTNGIIYNNGNDTCIVGFTPSLYWVDLGAEYDISKVRIHAYRADATYDYTTYLSAYLSATPPTSNSVDIPSGATTIIADPGDVSWATPDKTVILDSSVKARYLIVKRSNHSKGIAASNDLARLCLSEVEVYGTLAE